MIILATWALVTVLVVPELKEADILESYEQIDDSFETDGVEGELIGFSSIPVPEGVDSKNAGC